MKISFSSATLFAIHFTDGRVGTYGSFKAQDNAWRSANQAAALRSKSGSKMARVFPGESRVLEGTVLSTYSA